MSRIRALLTVISLLLVLAIQAQDLITIDAKNKSLSEVLSEISITSNYSFSYASQEIQNESISTQIASSNLEEVLNVLLADKYEWITLDNNVLIRSKAEISKNTKHIKGKITDTEGTPLAYATIQIDQSSLGTYTDEGGHFTMDIPDGQHASSLTVSYVGYEPLQYQINEIQDEYILLQLSTGAFSISEIKIVNTPKAIRLIPHDQSLILSQQFLSQNTSQLMSGDISRTLQLLAGISASPDNSSEIKIRGSNADETLMSLDGMPLYGTDHYYGIFSNLNGNYIDKVRLYKNYIPVNYGGKTAGVVALASNNKVQEKTSGHINIDLMSVDASSFIPLNDKWQIQLAGRSTLRDISNSQFNTFSQDNTRNIMVNRFDELRDNSNSDPSFRFYDMNTKAIYQPNPNTSLDINYFKSNDAFENNGNTQIRNNLNAQVDLSIAENQDWNTEAASMRWTQYINNNKLSISSHLSQYEENEVIGYTLDQQIQSEGIDTSFNFGMLQRNQLKDIGAQLEYHITNANLQLGLAYQKHDIQYRLVDNGNTIQAGNRSPYQVSLLAGKNWKINKQWEINTGLRPTYYSELDKIYFSPRFHTQYQVNDAWSWRASAGRYQQFIRGFQNDYRSIEKSYWTYASQDNGIPVLVSDNFSIGTRAILAGWTIDIEAYYKSLNGVQDYALVLPNKNQEEDNSRTYNLFIGEGRVRGIDASLSRSWRYMQSSLQYTLSKTEHRYKEIAHNNYQPAADDRRHELKWINQIQLKPIDIGLNFIYASGKPYTNVRDLAPNQDIRDLDNRFKQLPDYIRLDIGASYKWQIGYTEAQIGLSIFNVLNRQNVEYIQSIVSTVRRNSKVINSVLGNESNLLGRTVNVNASLRF